MDFLGVLFFTTATQTIGKLQILDKLPKNERKRYLAKAKRKEIS
jgi:hypothetical protein